MVVLSTLWLRVRVSAPCIDDAGPARLPCVSCNSLGLKDLRVMSCAEYDIRLFVREVNVQRAHSAFYHQLISPGISPRTKTSERILHSASCRYKSVRRRPGIRETSAAALSSPYPLWPASYPIRRRPSLPVSACPTRRTPIREGSGPPRRGSRKSRSHHTVETLGAIRSTNTR